MKTNYFCNNLNYLCKSTCDITFCTITCQLYFICLVYEYLHRFFKCSAKGIHGQGRLIVVFVWFPFAFRQSKIPTYFFKSSSNCLQTNYKQGKNNSSRFQIASRVTFVPPGLELDTVRIWVCSCDGGSWE